MGDLNRIQIKTAAVKIGGDLEMVTISEPTGTCRVASLEYNLFRHNVGDAMSIICKRH